LDLLVGKEVNLLGDIDRPVGEALSNIFLPIGVKRIIDLIVVIHVHTQFKSAERLGDT